MGQSHTAYCKMLSNHREIIVPKPKVGHILVVKADKSEGCNVLSELMLAKDFTSHALYIILLFNYPNYHTVENLISLATVRMGWSH